MRLLIFHQRDKIRRRVPCGHVLILILILVAIANVRYIIFWRSYHME